MNKDKLEKFKKLIEITNEGLTREEFVTLSKAITKQILLLEKKLVENINNNVAKEKEELNRLKSEFLSIINNAKKESDNTLGGFRKRTMEAINNLFSRNEVNKKLKNKLREANDLFAKISEKISFVKDGYTPIKGIDYTDGKDADEEKIVEEILRQVPDNKKYISKLEDKIYELEEELEKVKKIKSRGGGTSAIGIANAAKYFVKTEQPSGTINGTNKAFTVSKPIFAVLAFQLNGEIIARLPNYTISNKTVTFSEAIPAVYSGKDFEITYI